MHLPRNRMKMVDQMPLTKKKKKKNTKKPKLFLRNPEKKKKKKLKTLMRQNVLPLLILFG